MGFSAISGYGNATAVLDISPTAGFYIGNDFALGLGRGLNSLIGEGFSTTFASIGTSLGRSFFANQNVAFEPQLFFLASNDDLVTIGMAIGVSAFLGRNK